MYSEQINQLNTELSELKELAEIELPQPKPGRTTTEFYVTLAAQIIGLAVLLGVVPAGDSDLLHGWVVEAVKHGGALALIGASAWKYVSERSRLKG